MSAGAEMHAEHAELLAGIVLLREAADAVGRIEDDELRLLLHRARRFLAERILPHIYEEDRSTYPLVGKILGSARATACMSRDHVEIVMLSERLGQLTTLDMASEGTRSVLRATLYGLYAILHLHIAKEEELYVPLLEQHGRAGVTHPVFTPLREPRSR